MLDWNELHGIVHFPLKNSFSRSLIFHGQPVLPSEPAPCPVERARFGHSNSRKQNHPPEIPPPASPFGSGRAGTKDPLVHPQRRPSQPPRHMYTSADVFYRLPSPTPWSVGVPPTATYLSKTSSPSPKTFHQRSSSPHPGGIPACSRCACSRRNSELSEARATPPVTNPKGHLPWRGASYPPCPTKNSIMAHEIISAVTDS